MKKTAANISVPFLLILPVLWACSGDEGDWDATGSFEATEVTVSSEVSGRIESIHAEEGRILEKGDLAAEIDTVQLYLKKMQLESTLEAIRASRADIGLQIAATREQIAHNENEVGRTRRLIEAQAANSKQLDDLASNSRVLQKQLSAQLSTLTKSNAARCISTRRWKRNLKSSMITEKLRGPIVSRSFCIIFEENYCSFLILEAGIFFMAAESRAWGSWAP